jgi:hypothetical protein
MQLVRVIEVGMDVDGDGIPDLDASRIYYTGQSIGGIYGTLFLAVEPDVRVGVLTSATKLGPDYLRLANARTGQIGGSLAARVPALINSPGIATLDGIPVGTPRYNENLPLRNGVALEVRLDDGTTRIIQSPVINTVSGAGKIQEAFEIADWARQSGNPVAYAPHLRQAPLPGVQPKSVIYQFGKGDMVSPNPGLTAILRAGSLADRTLHYRTDIAVDEDAAVPKNPHQFMVLIGNPNLLVDTIARGAQEQIAVFFASDGKRVIHPEPARLFEVPIAGPLPEEPNFIP